jgi:hypothetical protein
LVCADFIVTSASELTIAASEDASIFEEGKENTPTPHPRSNGAAKKGSKFGKSYSVCLFNRFHAESGKKAFPLEPLSAPTQSRACLTGSFGRLRAT